MTIVEQIVGTCLTEHEKATEALIIAGVSIDATWLAGVHQWLDLR